MRNTGPTLPTVLLRELDLEGQTGGARQGGKLKARSWKDQRRAERSQSKSRRLGESNLERARRPEARTAPPPRPRASRSPLRPGQKLFVKEEEDEEDAESDEDEDQDDEFDGFDPSETEPDDGEATRAGPAATGAAVPKKLREKLAQDDAEIASLERKLGIKGRKSLPKSFDDDGLGDLLENLGDENGKEMGARKRKAEDDEWLRRKRTKAARVNELDDGEGEDDEGGEDDDDEGDEDDEEMEGFDMDSEEDSLPDEDDRDAASNRQRPQRENPYVAPTETGGRYVPPSRRRQQPLSDAESELASRVRRQAQGLINRLTEANMLAILGDIEKLYREHPRQRVTDAVVEALLAQVADPAALPDTLLILVAGFSAAVYRVIGTDFGAHLIQLSTSRFRAHYETLAGTSSSAQGRSASGLLTKEPLNLLALFAELYNFKVVGPNLVFDYIRLLLEKLSELNAELLLRVIRVCGHQLRQDDPLSLKDIVALIRPAVLRAGGEQNISVRTKFMIETINDLKNNKMKASVLSTEHATRMRKMLGNLSSRKLESTEPLRIGLQDIERSDRQGKWWLVGASWSGRAGDEDDNGQKEQDAGNKKKKRQSTTDADDDDQNILGSWGGMLPDIEELEVLAREQGMNTNVRRSIFIALLSAADFEDAHTRLLKLRLSKNDKREIPHVLMRCVGSEEHYNPYYSLVAREVCGSDPKTRWAFQDGLWKLFRRMGEPLFGEGTEESIAEDEDDELVDLRRLANVARMYGFLIADGCLELGVLKCLDLARAQAKARAFVEVLFMALFEEARKAEKGKKAKAGRLEGDIIQKRFGAIRDRPDLVRGLQYFMAKVMRKSKLAVGKQQTARIKRACQQAEKALEAAARDDD